MTNIETLKTAAEIITALRRQARAARAEARRVYGRYGAQVPCCAAGQAADACTDLARRISRRGLRDGDLDRAHILLGEVI